MVGYVGGQLKLAAGTGFQQRIIIFIHSCGRYRRVIKYVAKNKKDTYESA